MSNVRTRNPKGSQGFAVNRKVIEIDVTENPLQRSLKLKARGRSGLLASAELEINLYCHYRLTRSLLHGLSRAVAMGSLRQWVWQPDKMDGEPISQYCTFAVGRSAEHKSEEEGQSCWWKLHCEDAFFIPDSAILFLLKADCCPSQMAELKY